MSIEAWAAKTWKTQRYLLSPVMGFGALILLGGLVIGFPLLNAFGAAFLFAGGYGYWRLRAKEAAFIELLANPHRVAQVIPVVQTVQGGFITHYPVIVVADDGTPYRIGTWEKSVEAAVAPFLARFPHAKGLEKDTVFSPDDGFGVRLRMIGVMLLAGVMGLLFGALTALPRAISYSAAVRALEAQQEARNGVEDDALKALATAELTTSWNDCALESLKPEVTVLLDGATTKGYSSRREGSLRDGHGLTLFSSNPRWVSHDSFLSQWLNSMGTRAPEAYARAESPVAVLGVRRGDVLTLRLLDRDTSRVTCEGVTRIAAHKDDKDEENEALAVAVSAPFCKLLGSFECDAVARKAAKEPENEPPAPTTSTKKPKVARSAPALPTAVARMSADKAGILAAVRAITPRNRACYEQGLAKKPSLRGTLTMAFVIGSNGDVSTVSGSGFPDAAVTACVAKSFQALRFTPPEGGKATPVRYPIVFEPSK